MSKARSPREVCSTTIGTRTELCMDETPFKTSMIPRRSAKAERLRRESPDSHVLAWNHGHISCRKKCTGHRRHTRHRTGGGRSTTGLGGGRCRLWPDGGNREAGSKPAHQRVKK